MFLKPLPTAHRPDSTLTHPHWGSSIWDKALSEISASRKGWRQGRVTWSLSDPGKPSRRKSSLAATLTPVTPSPQAASCRAHRNQHQSVCVRGNHPSTHQFHQQAVGDLCIVLFNLLFDLLDGWRLRFFFFYRLCHILQSEERGFSCFVCWVMLHLFRSTSCSDPEQ